MHMAALFLMIILFTALFLSLLIRDLLRWFQRNYHKGFHAHELKIAKYNVMWRYERSRLKIKKWDALGWRFTVEYPCWADDYPITQPIINFGPLLVTKYGG